MPWQGGKERLYLGAHSAASELALTTGLPARRWRELPQPARGAQTTAQSPGYGSAGPHLRPTPPATAATVQGTERLRASHESAAEQTRVLWDKVKRKLVLPQAWQPPSEWESKRLAGPLQRNHVKALGNGWGHSLLEQQ